MIHLRLIGDFNDDDCGENIIDIDLETFNKYKPLIDAINDFTPYIRRHEIGSISYDNWESYRPDLGEIEIEEKYPQFSEEFIEEFSRIFIEGIDIPEEVCDPFIGPRSIKLLENILTGEVYIDGSYKTLRGRQSEKVKKYLEERSRILSYRREDGRGILSIPFKEMSDEEYKLLDELNNLWRKFV